MDERSGLRSHSVPVDRDTAVDHGSAQCRTLKSLQSPSQRSTGRGDIELTHSIAGRIYLNEGGENQAGQQSDNFEKNGSGIRKEVYSESQRMKRRLLKEVYPRSLRRSSRIPEHVRLGHCCCRLLDYWASFLSLDSKSISLLGVP